MTTLETQAGALEQMNMTKVATSAMKAGAQTIAAETAAMGGIDEIDKLMAKVCSASAGRYTYMKIK